jgi:hypothetical protein
MNTNNNTKEITYISTSYSLIDRQTKYAKKTEAVLVYAPYIIGECTTTITSALLEEAKTKVNAVNRERHMDSVLEEKEFIRYAIEETEEYKNFQETYFGKDIKYGYTTVDVNTGNRS